MTVNGWVTGGSDREQEVWGNDGEKLDERAKKNREETGICGAQRVTFTVKYTTSTNTPTHACLCRLSDCYTSLEQINNHTTYNITINNNNDNNNNNHMLKEIINSQASWSQNYRKLQERSITSGKKVKDRQVKEKEAPQRRENTVKKRRKSVNQETWQNRTRRRKWERKGNEDDWNSKRWRVRYGAGMQNEKSCRQRVGDAGGYGVGFSAFLCLENTSACMTDSSDSCCQRDSGITTAFYMQHAGQ